MAIIGDGQIKYVADKGFVNPDAACVSDAWVGSKALLDAGGLTDFSSLSGKQVVSFKGNIFEYAFDVMLNQAGLTEQNVDFVDIRDNPTRLEALAQNTIDVAVLGEPWITRAVNMQAGRVWVPFSEIIPGFSVGAITYGPSLLEDNPEAGFRFMVAYLKAVRQFDGQGKSDRNIEIISKYTKMSAEELNEICWTSFKTDGLIEQDSLGTFNQWAVEKGYITEAVTLDQVWDPQFIDAANLALNN